jgi:plasmid stabilization system protein ParE
MRKLHIQPQVHADLVGIWNYISERSPDAADIVLRKLEDAIRGLVLMPGKGHRRADAGHARYRCWSVYSFIIAYRYDDTSLTVVPIVHGRRSFPGLFTRRP